MAFIISFVCMSLLVYAFLTVIYSKYEASGQIFKKTFEEISTSRFFIEIEFIAIYVSGNYDELYKAINGVYFPLHGFSSTTKSPLKILRSLKFCLEINMLESSEI
eukprot:GHVR01031552.1.p1 GENE.GHVR01031552.1~~GHVR01031552.1.p1  ORF type:complete len:105 (+),score=2.83 GHVR01031552.1:367-681(+)